MTPVDIVVLGGRWNEPVVMVQVRAASDTDAGWAQRIRDAVVNDDPYGTSSRPFFIVVARDYLYLWTSGGHDRPHDEKYRTADVFAGYFTAIGTTATEIAPSTLELVVGIWLKDMNRRSRRESVMYLDSSGLPDAVEGGHIRFLNAA
jgi:hypothetical protein